MAKNVEVVIIARDRASKTLKGIGNEADTTGSKLSGIGGKIGKVGKAAAVAGAAVASAGVVAGVGLYKAVGAASDLSETINKTNVIFGKGAGLAGNDLNEFSTDMVTLAGDFASFHNASPEEAITAIGAALRGESEPIRRFGVMLDDATLRNRALKMGLISSTKEALTPQTKALAAQAEIMAQSKDAQGDFARTSDGLANAQRRIKAAVGDVVAEFGTAFMPVAEKVAGVVADKVVPGLRNLATKVAPVVQKVMAGLGQFWSGTLSPLLQKFGEKILPILRDAWDEISGSIRDSQPGLKKFGGIITAVADFILNDVVPVLVKHLGKAINVVVKTLGWLGDILQKILPPVIKFAATFIRSFANMQDAVYSVFGGMLTAAEKAFGWIPGIGDKIKGAKTAFDGFREHTKSNLNAVADGLDKTAEKIENLGSKKATPKIGAEITDLERKIATAKTKLSDPNLTKERKAEIKAEIEQLVSEVARAKAKIGSVNGKTVSIKVGVTTTVLGKQFYVMPGTNKKIPLFTAAGGGLIRGPGTGISDSIPARLSDGEYVIRAAAVSRYGASFFDALNEMKVGTRTPVTAASPMLPTSGSRGGGDVHVYVNGGFDSKESIAREVQKALLDLKRRTGGNLGLA